MRRQSQSTTILVRTTLTRTIIFHLVFDETIFIYRNLQGSQGIPGPREDGGREGPPGKRGPTGIKGIKGKPGFVGMKGERGVTGMK